MKSVSIPLYKEILLDLQRRIRHGFYGVSGRLPSRRELCGIYGISEMTAYRVQTQLEREGFARREKGRGVFAVPSRELPAFDGTPAPEALRRIFILGMKSAFAPSLEHNLRMAAGAKRRAAELGLETCRAFLDGPAASEIPNDADGLLLLYTPHIDWGHPLLRMRRLRKIMLNNVFPDMHCVLCGNHAGMAALLDHLAAKGVRSVCFCGGLFCDLGLANLCERTEAFRIEAERRRLAWSVREDGDCGRLLCLLADPAASPGAVLFATDYPAIRFRGMLSKAHLRTKTLLCGFDGVEGDLDTIISYRVDYKAMGEAAVDLMIANSPEDWMLPRIHHVSGSGKLIELEKTDGKDRRK